MFAGVLGKAKVVLGPLIKQRKARVVDGHNVGNRGNAHTMLM